MEKRCKSIRTSLRTTLICGNILHLRKAYMRRHDKELTKNCFAFISCTNPLLELANICALQ